MKTLYFIAVDYANGAIKVAFVPMALFFAMAPLVMHPGQSPSAARAFALR